MPNSASICSYASTTCVSAARFCTAFSLRHCAAALLDDPAYGALLIPLSRAHNIPLMLDIAAMGKKAGKPVGIVWLSQWLEGHGIADFEACPDLFVFRSMQSCCAAIAAWHARWHAHVESADSDGW